MKSNSCKLVQGEAISEAMLKEVKKSAVYNDLSAKETLKLTLLAEEMIGMIPNLADGYEGEFWIENTGKKYELHASLNMDEYTLSTDEKLLSVSKSGKNAAAKGIVGKIRSVIDKMSVPGDAAMFVDYGAYSGGMIDYDLGYAHCWSLYQYQNAVAGAQDSTEKAEAWDELEKSVITKISDDVIVGIKGRKVDIIVKKAF